MIVPETFTGGDTYGGLRQFSAMIEYISGKSSSARRVLQKWSN